MKELKYDNKSIKKKLQVEIKFYKNKKNKQHIEVNVIHPETSVRLDLFLGPKRWVFDVLKRVK